MSETRKMILLANFLAIAIVLNIIESAIPIIPVPGAKLGFANIVTLIVLYVYGFRSASTLTLMRVLLVSLLTGKFLSPTFYLSLSGAVFALLAMGLFKKLDFFSMLGVSVIGSILHAIGQIAAAIIVLETPAVVAYLPLMLLVSVPAGVMTGLIGRKFHSVWGIWNGNTSTA
jgi:heptaprenyl diphosphate synthase